MIHNNNTNKNNSRKRQVLSTYRYVLGTGPCSLRVSTYSVENPHTPQKGDLNTTFTVTYLPPDPALLRSSPAQLFSCSDNARTSDPPGFSLPEW